MYRKLHRLAWAITLIAVGSAIMSRLIPEYQISFLWVFSLSTYILIGIGLIAGHYAKLFRASIFVPYIVGLLLVIVMAAYVFWFR